MPGQLKALLGLSHKFIPVPMYQQWDTEEIFTRLERDIYLKYYFADNPLDSVPPPLRLKSHWWPPFNEISQEVVDRVCSFIRDVRPLFTPVRGRSNLLPFQRRLLTWLRSQSDFIIAKTDKGLGPCAIEYHQYAKDVLVHFSNPAVYQFISKAEADNLAESLHCEIQRWIERAHVKNVIDDDEVAYLRKKTRDNREDPHGYFYLMYKIHKTPVKTRPVCSDCASVTNPLSKWVDLQLQPHAQAMKSYFKDSFELKEKLNGIVVPQGARLFTADATSMYTNIDTERAMETISDYFRSPRAREIVTVERLSDAYISMLIEALGVVMRNNTLRCGDVFVKQISGTAMGKPPAPSWANLFQGLHEEKVFEKYEANLFWCDRFIDDIGGLWQCDNTNPLADDIVWENFKSEMQQWGLEWIFSERGQSAVFLDLTITIAGDRLTTTLYEKPMALHLYIPPHSAHPPGVLTGHVFGEVLRIHRLCSEQDDVVERMRIFYRRLLLRGHKPLTLIPLFRQAIANAKRYITSSKGELLARKQAKRDEAMNRVYFHLPYHPQGPKAGQIQASFDRHVLHPPGDIPFKDLRKPCDVPCHAMIVAHHRPLNLGNLLSNRKVSERYGPPISAFINDS